MDVRDVLPILRIERAINIKQYISSIPELKDLSQQAENLDLTTPVENINTCIKSWEKLIAPTEEHRPYFVRGTTYQKGRELPMIGAIALDLQEAIIPILKHNSINVHGGTPEYYVRIASSIINNI